MSVEGVLSCLPSELPFMSLQLVLYPWELETGSGVDRAIVLLMDPLGHLRMTSRPLVEV